MMSNRKVFSVQITIRKVKFLTRTDLPFFSFPAYLTRLKTPARAGAEPALLIA